MNRKWLLAGAAIVLSAVAVAAFFLTRSKPPAASTHPATPPTAAASAPPPAAVEIIVSGQVQAANVVNVPAPVDGTIDELMADVGDVVIEGKLLARIKNPKLASAETTAQSEAERQRNRISGLESALISARLDVSRTEADQTRIKQELEKAEKEYQRQESMFRQGITPRVIYERAQQEYNAYKADSERLADVAKDAGNRVSSLTDELQTARADLDQKKGAVDKAHAESGSGEVRSPAEGIVVVRCCQVGESVTAASSNLFQIAGDLTQLQVAASPDSATIEKIHPGQMAAIEIPAVSATIEGKVREVKPGQVIVEFIRPNQSVRPGMTARVKIKLS
ncbi:MAG TPA: efflux RND transporter periplasmic adaptor subunit [Bryobacteraceae bacterium]|jgi:multidrug resistance efflux pump|nr:efflux RND transporter periplasmic adaptor subunit [Bryobacteraceae bacterium]